jgi:MFS family permease
VRHRHPRQFWLLTLACVVLNTGIYAALPFESTYLVEKLGVSVSMAGLIIGLPLLVGLPLHALGGALVDRFGRRMAVVVAPLVTACRFAALAFGPLWLIAAGIAGDSTFGWPLFVTGSNAMTADITAVEHRGEAFSLVRTALNLGNVLGPLMAGAAILVDSSMRLGFALAAVFCISASAFGAIGFKESRVAVAGGVEARLATTLRGYVGVLGDRRFLALCGITLLVYAGFGQIATTLPLALNEASGVSPAAWSLVLTFWAVSVTLTQYVVVRALWRFDKLLLLAAAALCVGGGLAGAVLAPVWIPSLLFVLLLGQGAVIAVPVASALVAEYAPLLLRGRYMGVWTLVQMAGYALGPLLGGAVLQGLGSTGLSLVNLGVGGLAAGLFLALRARTTTVSGRRPSVSAAQ